MNPFVICSVFQCIYSNVRWNIDIASTTFTILHGADLGPVLNCHQLLQTNTHKNYGHLDVPQHCSFCITMQHPQALAVTGTCVTLSYNEFRAKLHVVTSFKQTGPQSHFVIKYAFKLRPFIVISSILLKSSSKVSIIVALVLQCVINLLGLVLRIISSFIK